MISRKLGLRKTAIIAFSAISLSAFAVGAKATGLVSNGSFESSTNGAGQLGYNTTATDWSTTGYNFLFTPSSISTGVTSQYGNLKLAGAITPSPDGGNFVAADGAFSVGPITQTLTGLTAGKKYYVSFDVAAAQQKGYAGTTTEGWTVGFGGVTQNVDITTAANPLPNQTFSGWTKKTLTFTATGSSQVLSFLAYGTPTGQPPFSLLDGVSVTVPEAPIYIGAIVALGLGAGLKMKSARKK
jgi:hypothetical protein